ESKIAESKAALCCGFAIALRALFLGVLCPLPCGGGKGVGCHVEAKPKHLKIFTTRDSSPAKQVQHDIVSLREALASRQSTVSSVQRCLIAAHSYECSQ
ncbi:MAG: hypothetical protein K2N69_06200, partial [Helicobacter sp.]|nr:hypothetical protein [Helicobacter sp.]